MRRILSASFLTSICVSPIYENFRRYIDFFADIRKFSPIYRFFRRYLQIFADIVFLVSLFYIKTNVDPHQHTFHSPEELFAQILAPISLDFQLKVLQTSVVHALSTQQLDLIHATVSLIPSLLSSHS